MVKKSMTRKYKIAPRVALPRLTDDLKRIKGIGPIFEKGLYDAGIRTFTQLAKKSPGYIATHIPNLSAKQIRKQGWIYQARKLASKKTVSNAHKKETAPSTPSQHYENFTVEFLLNEKNKLRRLRIMHVQSGDVETWANWRPEDVSHFLVRHTGARFIQFLATPNMEMHKLITKPVPSRQAGSTKEGAFKSEKIVDSSTITTETSSQIIPPIPKSQPISVAAIKQIRLLKWINSLSNSNQPVNSLPHDHNFDMKLTLDLTKTSLTGSTQLDLTGMVFAKKMGYKTRQLIGETQISIQYAPAIDLTICNASLTPGLYRLEALVNLNSAHLPSKRIDVSFPGGLFQVY
jgi:hypothetical protein